MAIRGAFEGRPPEPFTPPDDGATSTLCGIIGGDSSGDLPSFEDGLPSGNICFGISTGRLAGCSTCGRLDKSLIETVLTNVAGEEETVTVADWAAAVPQAAAKLAANNVRDMGL